MILKLIIVSPKYQINLGSIARVAKNFGISRLHLVLPRADPHGKTAIMFSKHAKELLLKARIYGSLREAVRDCDVVVGTTGLWRKGRNDLMKPVLAAEAADLVAGGSGEKTVVGLVIGRDDIGLLSSEMELCDTVAYIGTSEDYSVLNISHATAVMLYIFTRKTFQHYKEDFANEADPAEKRVLIRIFENMIHSKKIRNKGAVTRTFRRVVNASFPTREEVHALITALK